MAEASLIFQGKVVGIEQSVADTWKRVEAQKYTLKPVLDSSRFGIRALTDETSKFNNELNRATNRVLSFATAGAVFLTFQRGLRELVGSTINVEQSLARINVNLGQSAQGLKQFSSSLFDIARNTGSSFDDVAKAAEELARQGLSATETLRRLKDASVLARIAGIDTTDAVTGLTAAVNTFSKDALTTTDIVAKLAAVDTRFAVSSRDLTQAISRVGSAAQEAGISFNELIAIVTAVQQSTQRGGAAIGNAFKSIFQRISRPESLEQLQQLGVVVKDVNDKFLPGIAILKNLANAYDGLSQAQKAQIADSVGGLYQINILKAAVKDLSNEQGVYAQALKTASAAAGEATQKNEELNRTLKSTINSTGLSIKQLFATIGGQSISPILKTVLGNVEDLRRYLSGESGSSLGEALGNGLLRGISAVLTGPALLGSIVALGNAFRKVFASVGADVKGLLGINSLTEQRAVVLGRIQLLMDQATAAEAAQVSTASTLLGQKEAILAISQRIALQEERAAAAAAAQASLFLQGGRISLPRVGRAAGGYLPAIASEGNAIAKGVGGASASARPVVIPNFAYGGGMFGPIVANSDEYVVPNYAGGGSAIFNPSMVKAFGLPQGAKKVGSAAGGYVPNAAVGGTFGDVRNAGGQFVSAADIRNLESLFLSVRQAGDGVQARELGRNVLDFSQKLNQASQLNIREKLGQIYSQFDKGIPQAVRAGILRANNEGKNFYQTPTGGGLGTDYSNLLARSYRRRSTDYNAYPSPIGPTDPYDYNAYSTPIGPPVAPSLFSKIKGRLTNPNTLLGASFALPLLSGFIPQGQGGTGKGEALGALSGGLQGAGTGAIFGLPGAGVGLVIGALIGAFSKATKSVEEFAGTLKNPNTKAGLTALYGVSENGTSPRAASASVAGAITKDIFSKINLTQLNDIAYRSQSTEEASKRLHAIFESLGGDFKDFEFSAKDTAKIAETLSRATLLAGQGFKKAADEAARAAVEQQKAGLSSDSFLTRGEGFAGARAFGGANRGIRNQFQRANLTRGAFESLIETGAIDKSDISDNRVYQRAKGIDQSQNALAYLATYLEAKIPSSRFQQNGVFFKNSIGETLKRIGLVGSSVADNRLTDDQSFARLAYNRVFNRASNTIKNVGGVVPSPYSSENGITTGVNSESFSPTNAKGQSVVEEARALLKDANQVADKIGKSTFEVVLKLDGTYNVVSDTLSGAQLKGLAQELTETIGKHFEAKISEINKQISDLRGKPMPPQAPSGPFQGFGGLNQITSPRSQPLSTPISTAKDLTFPGAAKPIPGRNY